ncbi:YbhB/YbcL family Raf kinase inhibitor-like protein [Candidatus Babeliales bacterium]|nr:YbhB/YbcL family Raf kinase inhibitor-like protein [Candidatus Babeliales bacterium]
MVVGRRIVFIFCFLTGFNAHTAHDAPSIQGEVMNVVQQVLTVTSSAFKAGEPIPPQYSCDGDNRSPQLLWDNAPQETQSFVLFCDDPDAPGKTWVHWVAYNIPANSTGLAENIEQGKEEFANGMRQGKSDFGKIGYGGPCPPSGVHRYFFKVYALSKKLDLAPGATKKVVEMAMQGLVIGAGQLMGTYARSRD